MIFFKLLHSCCSSCSPFPKLKAEKTAKITNLQGMMFHYGIFLHVKSFMIVCLPALLALPVLGADQNKLGFFQQWCRAVTQRQWKNLHIKKVNSYLKKKTKKFFEMYFVYISSMIQAFVMLLICPLQSNYCSYFCLSHCLAPANHICPADLSVCALEPPFL